MSDDIIGQTLSHYSVLDKLGEGGMGVVYRGVDTRLNRPVALKVLPPEATTDPERVRRFTQEAQAASALNHPNIITIHDVGEAGGVSFIAMEYVAGRTLDQMIGRKGLPLGDALKYGAQVADALAAAHAAGIVHRDLKPGNVMVTDAGRIKVVDFGLAKQVPFAGADLADTRTMHAGHALHTVEGTILGTVAYMSPEQAEGKRVDARSDIFSFGSLLYEMVTGQRAFQGETKVSTLSAILQREPRPVSEIAHGVPPELDHIIAHCLRKEPGRRFQHLDDVRTLLEALTERTRTRSGATAQQAAGGSVRARRRWIAAATVAAVAGSVVVWMARDRILVVLRSAPPPVASAVPTTPAQPRLSTGGPASANPEANRYFETAMQATMVGEWSRSRTMIERALQMDPGFAEARAWYGFTNWLLLDQGFSNDRSLLYKAEEELRAALKQDSTLARAHTGFAAVYMMQGRKDLVPAEIELAEKVNPGDAEASAFMMKYHQYSGDFAIAKRVAQDVLARRPLFFPNRMLLGEMLRQEGDLAGAIREQERILEQEAQNIYAIPHLARAYLDSGEVAKAREMLNRARPADRKTFRHRRTWALLLALEGHRAQAIEEMDEEVLKWGALLAYETSEVAEFYALLGDAAKALEWLDRSVSSGDERAEWFRRDPLLAAIRGHPGFQQILESIAYRRQQRKPRQ